MTIILSYCWNYLGCSVVLVSMLQRLLVVKEMDAVSLMHPTKEEFSHCFSAFHGYMLGLLSQRACIRLVSFLLECFMFPLHMPWT